MPIPAAIKIRGIRLNNLAMEDALNAIDGALVNRTPVNIAFVNADCVNLAARDPAYQATLEAMDWVFMDGIGMKLAGKLLHQPVRANVNGTDLFPQLCTELGKNGRRIFFYSVRNRVLRMLQLSGRKLTIQDWSLRAPKVVTSARQKRRPSLNAFANPAPTSFVLPWGRPDKKTGLTKMLRLVVRP